MHLVHLYQIFLGNEALNKQILFSLFLNVALVLDSKNEFLNGKILFFLFGLFLHVVCIPLFYYENSDILLYLLEETEKQISFRKV